MAKVKVDTTGVEASGSGDVVKPGLYKVKIEEAEIRDSKAGNPQLALIYVIEDGDFKGRKLFDYIPLDNDEMQWKLAAFQDAIKMPRKGTLDTDKLEGKKLQVRTTVQKSEEFGEQARVRNTLPTGKTKDEDLGEDEEAEDEGEEEEAEEEDEDDEEEVDLDDLDRKELKEFIKENELEVKVKKSMDDAAIRAAILEELGEDEDEDEEDEEEEEETEPVDYSSLDLAALKEELKERGLKTAGKRALLIARLEKDDESGKGDDGEPF